MMVFRLEADFVSMCDCDGQAQARIAAEFKHAHECQ